ncbi:MAG: hypothetical protein ACOC80_12785, partial [Petrotogales bacterium]
MPSTDIISRLATRFNNATGEREHPDFLTRDIGGQFRNNQPYISGYFQIIVGLPSALFNGESNAKTASQWLHSTCESFTPHTQTLNKVDVQGQGQTGSSFAASTTTTREITLAFREYQNLPILNVLKQWSSVFDPFTGVSPLEGNRFIPANYKGWVAVAQTKPVGARDAALSVEDIEEAYVYHGVFPTNVPLDALNSEITANDTAQLSCTFSFDGTPLTSSEPGVTEKVVSLFETMQNIGSQGESKATTY